MKKETYPQSFRFVKSCSLAIVNRWRWKAAGGDVLIVGSLETKMKSKISATRLAPKLDKGQLLRNLDKHSADSAEMFVVD